MSLFLRAALFAVAAFLFVPHAHAQICQPNPNAAGNGVFTNNCPDSASGLTKSFAKLAGFSVPGYGAVGNGGAAGTGTGTDDSIPIAAAIQACGLGNGGYVVLPPTGHSYVIKTASVIAGALAQAPGCHLKGYGGFQVPQTASGAPNFYDNVEADWETAGSWIRCDDTSNACLDLTRQGQGVEDINFWYTQPTPASTTCSTPPCAYTHGWTPTVYPYTIKLENAANTNLIRNVRIVNGYDCIDVEGQTSGFAGTYSSIENVGLGCFDRDIRMARVDNTLHIQNERDQHEWYQGSTDVFGFMEGTAGHGVGWDANYVANLTAEDVEFDWKQIGILLTDATVTNGFGNLTFAGANWNLHGVSFNEVCQAMKVANGTTHFAGGSLGNAIGMNVMHGVTVFADTLFSMGGGTPQCAGLNSNMFDLRSDNVALQIHGLNVGSADTIAAVGNGTSGYLGIYGMRAQGYSTFNTGKPAFLSAAGASLDFPGDQFSIVPQASAGPFVSGAATYMPFSIQAEGQINAPAGTGRELFFGTNPATGTQTDHGTLYRWGVRSDGSAEGGSNAGSNFSIDRYNDAGSFVDSPITVTRSNGFINFNDIWAAQQVLVANLPTCNAQAKAGTVIVTDQLAALSPGATVTTGGGGNIIIAVCDGISAWKQH